jgi:hypothetical protein
MYYAREAADDMAINWYLSGPEMTSSWVNACWRYTDHKVSCDAMVESTHHGDLHCGYMSCSSTDTSTTCWKRVWASVGGYKVRYRVSYAHCSSQSDTTRY